MWIFPRSYILVLTIFALTACAAKGQPDNFVNSVRAATPPEFPAGDRECKVKSLKLSEPQGLKIYSPDGRRYLLNKKDENKIDQIFVGETGGDGLLCLTCTQMPGGPKPEKMKMQPTWYPSGRWIFMAVEREDYAPPPLLGLSRKYVEGELQCGIWTNMYAVSIDGRRWRRLTDFQSNKQGIADGYTGPAFTRDGRRAVWSQIISGDIFSYWPFGRWQLILADVEESENDVLLKNPREITPVGMNWNEPGNFHPDHDWLLLSGSTAVDAQGMDQYILDVDTGGLKNLTNSPNVWDEHGLFSPDGTKVIFMSAYPYRADPKSSKVLSIKTEFMLMNIDGTKLSQLTHFREPGYPEYGDGIAAAGGFNPDGHSAVLRRLLFPEYQDWTIEFEGNCGRKTQNK